MRQLRIEGLEHEADGRGGINIGGVFHAVCGDGALRSRQADLLAENGDRQLDDVVQVAAAARDHHAGGQLLGVSRLLDDVADRIEDLAHPRFDHTGQQADLDFAVIAVVFVLEDEFLVFDRVFLAALPVQDLDGLGPVVGDAGHILDVGRHRFAAEGDDGHVTDDIVLDDGHAGRTLADVHQRHAVFHLGPAEDGTRGGDRRQDGFVEFQAAVFENGDTAVEDRALAAEEAEVGFDGGAHHADEFVVGDAETVFRAVLLRNGLEDGFALRDGRIVARAGDFPDFLVRDVGFRLGPVDLAGVVLAVEDSAGEAHRDLADLFLKFCFGLGDQRTDDLLDLEVVDDLATFDAGRCSVVVAGDPDAAGRLLTDGQRYLGASEIQCCCVSAHSLQMI